VSLTNFWFNLKMTETQMIVIITAVVVFLLVLPAIGIVAWLFVNGKIGKTLKFDGKWLP